ncbi:MAG: NAD(P)-binding domain-containing protein [Desulfobacterales bacterium]|nr:NAD(P)-binding domain-containing protein [Desulfobacterales bacterium]MDX2510942.1 NAD(P)-binding domain-containing protein [Desulfobacterales bacterium]
MTQGIGFIGLGQMGKWMALNFLKADCHISVYDINTQAVDLLVQNGATASQTPAHMATQCEVVFLSLPDTDIVEQTIFGETGLIQTANKEMLIVDLSTISYLGSVDIARKLNQKDIFFCDAPVSGMKSRAKEATLTIMVGGPKKIFDRIYPLLKIIGNTVLHMGPVGSGQLTKLVNQLLFDINAAGLAEVLPMAAKLGLDPAKVCQIITTGTGRSFAAEFFTPLTLENRFDEGYPLKSAYKDLTSAAEISSRHKIPLPLTQATTNIFQMALAQGLGSESKGALIKVFEKILDVEFRKKGVK